MHPSHNDGKITGGFGITGIGRQTVSSIDADHIMAGKIGEYICVDFGASMTASFGERSTMNED
jgi:hypothetical protein